MKSTDHCSLCIYSKYDNLCDVLVCRRYPPIVDSRISLVYLEKRYPTVSASDWCGEFKEKVDDDLGSI